MSCAYCGLRPGTTRDHVLPKAFVRQLLARGVEVRAELRRTVPACHGCNVRKGNRKLIPASWRHLLNEINALAPNARTQFVVWRGIVETVRQLCRWCDKVVAENHRTVCRQRGCKKVLHKRCVEGHLTVCAAAKRARARRAAA